MKKGMLCTAVILGLSGQFALATEMEPHIGAYIDVFADYHKANWDTIDEQHNKHLGEGYGPGLALGYDVTELWGFRFEYAKLQFNDKTDDSHQTGYRKGADVVRRLANTPFYGVGGLKKISGGKSIEAVNLGVGGRFNIAKNWAISAETNWYKGLDVGYRDLGVKLGISYLFGAKESTPYVAPKQSQPPVVVEHDTDKDGVIDAQDKCTNTPMQDAVDSKGCSIFENKTDSIRLLVTFSNDNSDITSQYQADIEKVAKFMKAHPKSKVVLEGHTSSIGKSEYNKALSVRRAEAVAKALMLDHTIDKARVEFVGLGEEKLKNTGNNAAAHAENRRVEAVISITEKVKVKR